MCIAFPHRIKSVKKNEAVIENGKIIDTILVGQVRAGNWVLVKDTYAVSLISKNEAADMIDLLEKTQKAGDNVA